MDDHVGERVPRLLSFLKGLQRRFEFEHQSALPVP